MATALHLRFATGLVAFVLATCASAHDTWMSSRASVVTAGRPIAFELTSAHRFPTAETAPKPERIAQAECRQEGADVPLQPGAGGGARSLQLIARPTTGAGLLCRVDLAPRGITLDAEKVDRYLKEIDASAEVRAAWAASTAPRRWVETYSKHAKTIVPGAASRMGDAPFGAALEFVPDQSLSTGRVDGALSVRVLKDGAPLPGLGVELVRGRDSRGTWRRSDGEGRVTFDRPAPGRWMLRATDLRATDVAQGLWESHFVTLVFDVVAAPR